MKPARLNIQFLLGVFAVLAHSPWSSVLPYEINGNSVTLKCNFTEDEDVNWYFGNRSNKILTKHADGKVVYPQRSPWKGRTTIVDGASLKIHEISSQDEGKYICKVGWSEAILHVRGLNEADASATLMSSTREGRTQTSRWTDIRINAMTGRTSESTSTGEDATPRPDDKDFYRTLILPICSALLAVGICLQFIIIYRCRNRIYRRYPCWSCCTRPQSGTGPECPDQSATGYLEINEKDEDTSGWDIRFNNTSRKFTTGDIVPMASFTVREDQYDYVIGGSPIAEAKTEAGASEIFPNDGYLTRTLGQPDMPAGEYTSIMKPSYEDYRA